MLSADCSDVCKQYNAERRKKIEVDWRKGRGLVGGDGLQWTPTGFCGDGMIEIDYLSEQKCCLKVACHRLRVQLALHSTSGGS